MMGVVENELVTNRGHIMQQNSIEFKTSFKFWQTFSLISSIYGGSILASFDEQRSISKYIIKKVHIFPNYQGPCHSVARGPWLPHFSGKNIFVCRIYTLNPKTDVILACPPF